MDLLKKVRSSDGPQATTVIADSFGKIRRRKNSWWNTRQTL